MSELPRVLLCAFEVLPSPTSVSRRLTEYLRALAGGFNVDVMTLKPPDLSHIEKYQGARLLRVPVGSGPLAAQAEAFERAVRRQIDADEYALIHFSDPFAGQPLCERKPELGYKLVYDALSFPSQEVRFTHPEVTADHRLLARIRRQELYCLMNADVVIAGSATAARSLQGLGVTADALRIVRAAADATPRPRATPAPGQPLRIVYAGSQLGWQGLPTLLRALSHVLARAPARLRLIGPPHPVAGAALRTLASELKLNGAVEFVPAVPADALPRLLAEADVAVAPLDDVERHRTGLAPVAKLADYLAAGLPVVASDLPLMRELLPASAGRFFRPGDALALAEHLTALAADPAARAQLSEAALAEAASLVDTRRMRRLVAQLYEDLLEGHAATATAPARSARDAGTPTTKLPDLTADDLTPQGAGPRWAAEGRWKSQAAPAHDWTPTSVRLQLEAEEPEEISNEEIVEAAAEDPHASAAPPTSKSDPWLTQLLHGYCPPEGVQFGRPTPPAQLIGREMSPARGVPALPAADRGGAPRGTKP